MLPMLSTLPLSPLFLKRIILPFLPVQLSGP